MVLIAAIEGIRQIGSGEEMVTDGPVLEEFIPLKPTSSSTEEEKGGSMKIEQEILEKKPDWLRSVQLWNQETDHSLPIVVRKEKKAPTFTLLKN